MKTKIIIILVVLIIIIGGIIVYQKDKSTTGSGNQLGIVVLSPKPNETIQLPVTITGYVNNNGWNGFEGEVGNVQLFSVNGIAKSVAVPLSATTDWMKPPVYFKVQIQGNQIYGDLEHSVVLVFKSSVAKDGEIPKEFKVPINLIW